MAFRPFEAIRKRSKIMMAILVLVAMFSFIFIGIIPNVGGEGTIIGSWFRRLFGQEEKVFTIDETGYGVNKTREMVARRRVAYDFLQAYFATAGSNIVQKYTTTSETPAGSENTEQRDAIGRMQHSVCYRVLVQRQIFDLDRSGPEGTAAAQETIEFAYYLQRADDLGIVIPRERVLEDLLEGSARTIREGDLPGLMLEWQVSASVDAALDAIADEIRANIAKLVLVAERPGSLALQPTPRELLDAWTYLAVNAKAALVEFKAEDYASQVEVPDETVLKAYFEAHKRYLPDPESEKPGFKIPPLFQMEYVYADASKGIDGGAREYYANQAANLRQIQLAFSPIRLKVGEQTVGVGPLEATVPVWIGASTLAVYEAKKVRDRDYWIQEHRAYLLRPSTKLADGTMYVVPPWFEDAAKLTRPQVEALNAGNAILALGTGLFPLAPPPGVNAALQNSIRVYHEYPVPYPAILGPGTIDAGLLPILLDSVRVMSQNETTFEAVYARKYRPIEEMYMAVLDAEMELRIRELLAKDMDQLAQNLAAHGVRYRHWHQKKLDAETPGAKDPVPPEPLFRDQFQPVKSFDFLLENGPVDLARTQGLPHEEPLSDYLARWAGERGIHLITRQNFGKPRSELDLLKPADGTTPMAKLYAHLLELERSSRAAPPPETETEKQREIIGRNILGPKYFSPQGSDSRPMGVPWDLFEPRWAMSSTDRENHGDAAGSPLFVRPIDAIMPREKPEVLALFWKATQTKERTPEFTEDGIRETVIKAYQLQHARDAAKKAADDFVAKLKDRPLDDILATLRDFEKEHPGRVKFDAPWRRFTWDRQTNTYSPEKAPPFIQYHAPETIETGLENLKALGDSMVIANLPKSHYYAVVLQERIDPTVATFDRDLVASKDPMVASKDPMVRSRKFNFWVLGRKHEEAEKQWAEYLRTKTGYDPESGLGKVLLDLVKHRFASFPIR